MSAFLVAASSPNVGTPAIPRTGGGLLTPGAPAGTTPTVDPAATASTASRGSSVGLLPILDGGYGPDSRFAMLDVPVRPDGGKYPRGTIGIVIPGTKETGQENLFFPSVGTSMLVAVNHAGDPLMGSTVGDLNDLGEIDPGRVVRIQSAWWVIKGAGSDPNSLAWQLGKSGRGDVYGGMVIDTPGGTAPQGAKVIGCVSVNLGGFIDVGSTGDRHKLHVDADGHTINRAHISTGALFRMNDQFDGPLAFEPIVPPMTRCGPVPTPVHFGYDPALGAWRWWGEGILQIITPPPKEPPPDPPPKEPPWKITKPPEPPWGGMHPPILKPPGAPPGGGDPPGHLPPFIDIPGGESGGGFEPTSGVGGGGPRNGVQDVQRAIDHYSTGSESPATPPYVETTEPAQPVASSHLELSVPSLLLRPASTYPGAPDLRSNTNPTPEELGAYNASSPATIHLEAFARTTQSGDWIYTTKPGQSRWPFGTAMGGAVLLSPEADIRNQDPAEFNRPASLSFFVAGPNVSFGAGPVDPEEGSLSRGYTWREDGVGGLTWRTVLSGSARDAIAFAPTTGAITVGVGPTSTDALLLDVDPTVGAGTHVASPSVKWTSRSNDGAAHTTDWRGYVEPTDFAGASNFTLSKQLDGGGYAAQFSVVDAAGIILYNNAADEGFIDVDSLVTADRTWKLPDLSGTFLVNEETDGRDYGATVLTDAAPVALTTSGHLHQRFELTAGGNRTIDASDGGRSGQTMCVSIQTDNILNQRTITFGANFSATGTISTPLATTNWASVSFESNGTVWQETTRQTAGV